MSDESTEVRRFIFGVRLPNGEVQEHGSREAAFSALNSMERRLYEEFKISAPQFGAEVVVREEVITLSPWTRIPGDVSDEDYEDWPAG